MGQPKQLLHYHGNSFVNHALKIADASVCRPIVLVLGANAEAIQPGSLSQGVYVVNNPEWPEGISASVRSGLSALIEIVQDIACAIFMVVDQPYVSTNLLNELVQKKMDTGKGIIACSYGDTIGTPVLFDQSFFPQLLALRGNEGAKQLIRKNMDAVTTISFPLGNIDIDTPEDYSQLKQTEKKTEGTH